MHFVLKNAGFTAVSFPRSESLSQTVLSSEMYFVFRDGSLKGSRWSLYLMLQSKNNIDADHAAFQ